MFVFKGEIFFVYHDFGVQSDHGDDLHQQAANVEPATGENSHAVVQVTALNFSPAHLGQGGGTSGGHRASEVLYVAAITAAPTEATKFVERFQAPEREVGLLTGIFENLAQRFQRFFVVDDATPVELRAASCG